MREENEKLEEELRKKGEELDFGSEKNQKLNNELEVLREFKLNQG
jgi:hypothetical protein